MVLSLSRLGTGARKDAQGRRPERRSTSSTRRRPGGRTTSRRARRSQRFVGHDRQVAGQRRRRSTVTLHRATFAFRDAPAPRASPALKPGARYSDSSTGTNAASIARRRSAPSADGPVEQRGRGLPRRSGTNVRRRFKCRAALRGQDPRDNLGGVDEGSRRCRPGSLPGTPRGSRPCPGPHRRGRAAPRSPLAVLGDPGQDESSQVVEGVQRRLVARERGPSPVRRPRSRRRADRRARESAPHLRRARGSARRDDLAAARLGSRMSLLCSFGQRWPGVSRRRRHDRRYKRSRAFRSLLRSGCPTGSGAVPQPSPDTNKKNEQRSQHLRHFPLLWFSDHRRRMDHGTTASQAGRISGFTATCFTKKSASTAPAESEARRK